MEAQQKKFFLISGGVLATIITLGILLGGEDESQQVVVKTETPVSAYDQKLKQARESSQNTGRLVQMNSGFYEADSIYTNGKVVENPVVVERKNEAIQRQARIANINEKMADAIGGLQDAANEDYEYYEDDPTPMPKPRNLTVKQYKRMMAQEQQQATSRKTPEPKYVETDKERRKRMFDGEGSVGATSMVCVIHRTQEVTAGSVVALRVVEECSVGDLCIPKNTIVYADLKVEKSRALLSVGTVRVSGITYSVALQGRGDDGLDGLPLSGSAAQKQVNTDVTDAVVTETTNLIASAAGSIGRTVGNIARGAVRGKAREQDTKVRLIDNQRITFYSE